MHSAIHGSVQFSCCLGIVPYLHETLYSLTVDQVCTLRNVGGVLEYVISDKIFCFTCYNAVSVNNLVSGNEVYAANSTELVERN